MFHPRKWFFLFFWNFLFSADSEYRSFHPRKCALIENRGLYDLARFLASSLEQLNSLMNGSNTSTQLSHTLNAEYAVNLFQQERLCEGEGESKEMGQNWRATVLTGSRWQALIYGVTWKAPILREKVYRLGFCPTRHVESTQRYFHNTRARRKMVSN